MIYSSLVMLGACMELYVRCRIIMLRTPFLKFVLANLCKAAFGWSEDGPPLGKIKTCIPHLSETGDIAVKEIHWG